MVASRKLDKVLKRDGKYELTASGHLGDRFGFDEADHRGDGEETTELLTVLHRGVECVV